MSLGNLGNNVEIIFGPPGTGKTTQLLDIIDREMSGGIPPGKIAFVSFTKKASEEAAERAMEKFNLTRNELPYFRTLHSLAFRELGLSTSDVLKLKHYQDISDHSGIHLEFTGKNPEEGTDGMGEGDRYLFVISNARARMIDLRAAAWEHDEDVVWEQLETFWESVKVYKKENDLVDFQDMLDQFVAEAPPLDIKVLVVDEAQDLSLLQWQAVHHLAQGAERIYLAGDDDQAIYQWSGAAVDYFMNVPGKARVLDKSYRLPKEIWHMAQKIANRIGERVPKEWGHSDNPGGVFYHNSIRGVDLEEEGTWMLLARNNRALWTWRDYAMDQGVPFRTVYGPSVSRKHLEAILAWEDLRSGGLQPLSIIKKIAKLIKEHVELPEAYDSEEFSISDLDLGNEIWHKTLDDIPISTREYYVSLLRSGYKLQEEPKIFISTIHGVKGGEADNVAVLTDLAFKSHRHYIQDPDSEHRVFYVGFTRAKRNLHVIEAQSNLFYKL